jgi:hypothetical protein
MTATKHKSFQQCVIDFEVSLRTVDADSMADGLTMLEGISAACSRGGFMEKGVAAIASEHWYTRAASALTGVLADPMTRLRQSDLLRIMGLKQTIVYVFAASGFRSTAHLIDLMKTYNQDGSESINVKHAAVLLMFLSLDDVSDKLMDIALQQKAELLIYLMLSWLNQRAVLTPQGEKNRGRLLTSGHLISSVEISDRVIPALANAWMYCSYASEPSKHDIKKHINQILLKRMLKANIQPKPVTHIIRKRPKVVVIHERFVEMHAMFRCYAPFIRSLAPYFETVAVADSSMIDQAADALFDKVIRLPNPLPAVQNIAQTIQEQDADVVYYPSLGMSHWTIMLAGLRLAPLQIMTQGHPATSKLESIDFAYINQVEGDPAVVHSERIIKGPPTVQFQGHPALPDNLPDLLPASNREVRIAVNSKVMKLSWRLLKICKRLQADAAVPVRFSFFPGERFLYGDGLVAAIRSQLPSATVLPYCDYERFLAEICKCDMALSAFPFGNTNSTVDTCLLGLPTVVHFGPESPAQTDALVLKTVGMPDWLICSTDEAYYQTALRMINEPARRDEAMLGINRANVRERLFATAKRNSGEPFGEVLFKLYRHFGSLRNSPQRVFDYEEILSMKS